VGKLTPDVFNPSCCDGGEAALANSQSARPCGCDPGANWVCLVCQIKQSLTSLDANAPVAPLSEKAVVGPQSIARFACGLGVDDDD
jgi:hypothetical protein